MSRFTFSCPQCGQPVEAEESFCGQTVECPLCGKGIVVPHAKRPSPSNDKVQLTDASSAMNGGTQGATARHVKSPKLHRIRQESNHDSFSDAPAESPSRGQLKGNIPSRYQPPTTERDEEGAERNDAGVTLNIMMLLCFIVALVVGGLVFVSSRCSKKHAELRNWIEQTGGQPGEKVLQTADRVRELSDRVREMSDRVRGLNEAHDALSGNLETVSRRVADMETSQRLSGEDLTSRNRILEEKCASLQNRIEELSRQLVENSRSAHQLERREPSEALLAQPQVIAQNEPEDPDGSSEESLDALQKKLNDNLAEIKRLRQTNPACYLNPKVSTIINRENKIATMKDRRYCTCVNVTFVRDAFYCSGCKQITPYHGDRDDYRYGNCKVCRQMSFYRWLEARKQVDETATINARIDELYAENESLEKQIRSMKNSRRRR